MNKNDSRHAELMRRAIAAAKEGIRAGQSPFGAVVATGTGEVVIAAHNMVRANCDATAHAEIMAIRGACANLGTIDLTGRIIATTCEPCPMCAAAIHWARLDAVIYGAGISDAQNAGFNELALPIAALYERGGSSVQIHAHVLREECVELFELWKRGPNPTPY
jgi:tRNA(Arg) A34 adenosine deaminase TadA